MTERDIDLINNNIKLVYKYFSLHNITDEDLRQELFMHLCERMHYYDDSKGKLSVFMYTVLDNRVKTLGVLKAKKHFDTIAVANKEEETSVYDLIPDKENTERYVEVIDLIKSSIDNVVKKNNSKNTFDKSDFCDIIYMIANGYNTREIAENYNCTRQNIHIMLTKVRNELKRLLEEENEENCY